MRNRAAGLIASSGKFASIACVGLRLLRMDLVCTFLCYILFPSGDFEPSHYNIIISFREENLRGGSMVTHYMRSERKREIIL